MKIIRKGNKIELSQLNVGTTFITEYKGEETIYLLVNPPSIVNMEQCVDLKSAEIRLLGKKTLVVPIKTELHVLGEIYI